MARMFQDESLLLWEAYATAPRSGEEHGPRIVFHCMTDPSRRARVLERDQDRTGIEERVTKADVSTLIELLEASEPLD